MIRADDLVHRLERTILIQAEPETVFRFFTDPVRWAAWWGAGSSIEPQVGGDVLIRFPDGTEVTGEVLEIVPSERLVFTYGFATGLPIPPGASRVTIRLEKLGNSTQLHLTHAFADPGARDEHVQGWRYQLSLFANVVTNELFKDAASVIDRWFATWSEPDASVRDSALRDIVRDDVRMRDRFSAIEGIADLREQLAAVVRFMPGITMKRAGDVRHCQGMALTDWVAKRADGQEHARGTNVFVFDARGRIEVVTGFWSAPAKQP